MRGQVPGSEEVDKTWGDDCLIRAQVFGRGPQGGNNTPISPLSSLCFFWLVTNMFGNWGKGPMNVFLQNSLGAHSGEEESE